MKRGQNRKSFLLVGVLMMVVSLITLSRCGSVMEPAFPTSAYSGQN